MPAVLLQLGQQVLEDAGVVAAALRAEAQQVGQIVPTDAILTHVWGYADSGDRALLKQLVYRVRQKIEAPEAHKQYIATIPGVGYRIANEYSVDSRAHGNAEG